MMAQPANPIPIDTAGRVSVVMREKHIGIPELSNRWGFSEDVIRRWFLEKPRPGVLKHSARTRGKGSPFAEAKPY